MPQASLQTGTRATVTRSFTTGDIRRFHSLAGSIAADGDDRVPEPLIGALFSYLLGVELPGFGTNYLKQEMQFAAPARVGQALTATVEITRLRPDKHLADLATTCTDAAGTVICHGRALVLVKDVGA